jgi:hypothetical protein
VSKRRRRRKRTRRSNRRRGRRKSREQEQEERRKREGEFTLPLTEALLRGVDLFVVLLDYWWIEQCLREEEVEMSQRDVDEGYREGILLSLMS